MNGTLDSDATGKIDEERGLDPREAAQLLEQTTRQALSAGLTSARRRCRWLGRRWCCVAFGALWLSVRGQHPYKGPTAPALVFMYGVLIAWIAVVVDGPSPGQRRGQRTVDPSGTRLRGGPRRGTRCRIGLSGGSEGRRRQLLDRLRDLPADGAVDRDGCDRRKRRGGT